MIFNSENCYDCIDCSDGYNLKHCIDCKNCSDCLYSRNLLNCKNCFGCTNLVGKSHCFENIQYTKEQYEDKVKQIQDYEIPARDVVKFMS